MEVGIAIRQASEEEMTEKLNAVDLLNRKEMRYGETACLQFKVVNARGDTYCNGRRRKGKDSIL